MRPRYKYSALIQLSLVLLVLMGIPANRLSTQNPTDPLQQIYQLRVSAEINGWDAQIHHQMGDLWNQLGDPLAAGAHWESSLQLNPDQPDLLRKLSTFYIQEQRWAEAVDTLRAQYALAPEEQAPRIQLGLILAPYDPQTAINLLQGVTFGPQIVTAMLNVLYAAENGMPDLIELGLTYGRYERWDLAELAFEHALSLGEPTAETLAYIGLARSNQGKAAEHIFAQALEMELENPQIWYLLGIYYRQQRRFDESLNSLVYGFSFASDNPFFALEIAEIYEEIGNVTLAEYWFNQARGLSNTPAINERVNRFFSENAAMLAAVESVERLPEIATDLTPEIRASLGWILYTSGSEAAGEAEIDKALAQNPNTPEALYYKANILLDQDNHDEAQRLLQQVANTNSGFRDDAQALLDRLFP